MLSPILVYIIVALIAGVGSFFISYRFNKSAYAATNRSGDFGTPRGGFFALLGGALIAMLFVNLGFQFGFIPSEAGGTAFMLAIGLGAASGVTGMFMGTSNRSQKKDGKDESDGSK